MGIGGTGMASLAGLLVDTGYEVTGSDKGKIYPPMSDQIKNLNIIPYEGYDPKNIELAKPDMVIIGNVIRKQNPEAQEVLRQRIPYNSMPGALYDFFLKQRSPIVIAGTHGKTTTSTMMAWLMSSCKYEPGFLIGGMTQNFKKSYSLGKDSFFIIEGDEYDTAFFDKGPKFLHYNPKNLILTSIEFDHADIYRDLFQIISSFEKLISIMPNDGMITANIDDTNVANVIKNARCKVITYGISDTADYKPVDIEPSEIGTSFTIERLNERFFLPMWGEYNVLNATSAIATLVESGFDMNCLISGTRSFKGVKKRQEVLEESKGITIIYDFAHHPTAIKKTIKAVKSRFPNKRIWAVFEPRSNSTRRNIFQKRLIDCFLDADRVIIAEPFHKNEIPDDDILNTQELAHDIHKKGTEAHSISTVDNIVEFIMRSIDKGDIILLMSNGDFSGLAKKLSSSLKKRMIVDDRQSVHFSQVPK